MDGLAPRLPARSSASPGSSSLHFPFYLPPAFFWWWFAYDAYAPDDLHRGRLHRRIGRAHRRGRRHRHVGLARARGEERRDLRLGALGAAEGDRARRPARARWRRARAATSAAICATTGRSMCCASRRRDRGKGVGLVIPSLLDLAGLGDRPRHQGRELAAHRRLPRPARPRAAVRSDQREVVRLQSAARGAPRRLGGPRRPEHRRHPGRSRRQRSKSATTGRRPATRSWSARSCTSSMPRRTRRSPASPPSCPIPSGRSRSTLAAMMTTPHLGEAGVHPVVASAARELLNKSENERSGVLRARPCRSSASIAIPSSPR